MDTPQPEAPAIHIQVTYGDNEPYYLAVSKNDSNLYFTQDPARITRFEPRSDGKGGIAYGYGSSFLNIGGGPVGHELLMRREVGWVLTPSIDPTKPRYLQMSGTDRAVGVYIFGGQPDWSNAYGVAPPSDPEAAPKDVPVRLPVTLVQA